MLGTAAGLGRVTCAFDAVCVYGAFHKEKEQIPDVKSTREINSFLYKIRINTS